MTPTIRATPMATDRPATNPVVRSLQLLTSGWGYNFYDDANKARADDLLVRQKTAHRLGEAVSALSATEVGFRLAFLPPATREQPFPPADAMERLRALGRLKASVDDFAVRLRGASVPTQDKVWFRFRQEQTLLYQLLSYDESMIADSERVADTARRITPESWHADPATSSAAIARALHDLGATLRERNDLLLMPTL